MDIRTTGEVEEGNQTSSDKKFKNDISVESNTKCGLMRFLKFRIDTSELMGRTMNS